MTENSIHAELSPAEWRLVQAMRELPESPLRNRVHEVFEDLLFFAANPRCQGVGAEGFPCGEPVTSCEECHEVWDLLETVSRRAKV